MRTLFDLVRNLFFTAKLPRKYWHFAVMQNIFLHNLTLINKNELHIPFDNAYQKKFNYDGINIFGIRDQPKNKTLA